VNIVKESGGVGGGKEEGGCLSGLDYEGEKEGEKEYKVRE